MKKFGFAVLLLLIGVTSYADITPPKTMKVKVAIGLGYQLCPERKTLPSLEEAYLCSGYAGTPQTVEVELTNQKAQKPTWLFYQGSYNQTLQFHDVTVSLESLVMFAKIDGGTTAFVDGRIISTRNGVASVPVYFRASAQGGFEKLAYSSTYGVMVPFPLAKSTAEFSPFMTLSAPE